MKNEDTDKEENCVRPTGGIMNGIDNVGDESAETTTEYSFIEDHLRPEKNMVKEQNTVECHVVEAQLI